MLTFAKLAFAATSGLLAATIASAQIGPDTELLSFDANKESWTAPNGRFWIDLPDGWGVVMTNRQPPQVLAHFNAGPPTFGPDNCFVQKASAESFNGRDQSSINSLVALWDDAQILRNVGGSNLTPEVQSSSYGEIGGVGVVSGVIRSAAERQISFHTRQFVLDENGAASFYAVLCTTPSSSEVSPVASLLDSLRFND